MKHKYALIATLAALPLMMPAKANADTCRNYTKTIRIDGALEVGVGQACRNYNGDWEIVSLKGPREIQYRLRDDIYEDLDDRGYRVIVVNNYGYPPRHYGPRYYDRVVYYQPRPAYFGFYFGDNKYDGRKSYKHKSKYDRYDRHDDDHHHGGHGKGKGHKKHH